MGIPAFLDFIKDKKETILPIIEYCLEDCLLRLPESEGREYALQNLDLLIDVSWECLVINSADQILEQGEQYIRQEIHNWLCINLKLEDECFKKELIDKLSDSLVVLIKMLHTGSDSDRLKVISVETGKLVAKRAAIEAISILKEELPESSSRDDMVEELLILTEEGIDKIDDSAALQILVKEHGIKYATKLVKQQLNTAINEVMDELPDLDGKQETECLLKDIVADTCGKLQQAESLDDIEVIAYSVAEQRVKGVLEEKIKSESKAYTSKVVQATFDMLRDKRRGYGNSRYNKYVRNVSERVSNQLTDNVSAVVSGKKDVRTAFNDAAKDVAYGEMQEVFTIASQKGSDYVYKALRKTGKGSRSYNRLLKSTTLQIADGASQNIISVMKGEKDVGVAARDAVKDVAIEKGREIAEEQAKILIEKGVEATVKLVNKNIKDKALKTAINSGVKSIGKSIPVTEVITCAIEISGHINRYLNGQISGDDLAIEVGRTAVSVCAMAIGGVVGGTAGAMVASLAADMIYSALLEGHYAKKHYENRKALIDAVIAERQARRIEFQREVDMLIMDRGVKIKKQFDMIDHALISNNLEAFTDGINGFISEFGGENDIKSLREFDDLLKSDEYDEF